MDELRALADQAAITRVIQQVARAFDEKRHDELLPQVFLDGASVTYFLSGAVTDFSIPAGIARFKAFHERCWWTQHLVGPSVIDLDGDTAQASSSVIATHVQIREDGSRNVWVVAASYFDDLVRTADGWRIRSRRAPCMHEDGAFEAEGVRLYPALPDVFRQGAG